MATLTREEHGEERAGKITSSVVSRLFTGTKRSWESLAQHLDDPPPFYQATSGPMAEGVRNEPKLAARFLNRHGEIEIMENPVVVRHHNRKHPYWDLIASSPDRVVDGLPLEIKFATTRARYEKLAKPVGNGWIPPEHVPQCMWHAWIMGVDRCWFAVGTERQISDTCQELVDLSICDRLLEEFMIQYQRYNITGKSG